MRRNKKNSMDWKFNQTDAKRAIRPIGARNLTVVEAVYSPTADKEEVHKTYSEMVQHNSYEADVKLTEWINKTVREFDQDYYLYFRFKRWN